MNEHDTELFYAWVFVTALSCIQAPLKQEPNCNHTETEFYTSLQLDISCAPTSSALPTKISCHLHLQSAR
eukprot:1161840-Pelagomonas_calceolata.AAC.3